MPNHIVKGTEKNHPQLITLTYFLIKLLDLKEILWALRQDTKSLGKKKLLGFRQQCFILEDHRIPYLRYSRAGRSGSPLESQHWEVEAGRSRGQEIETILVNIGETPSLLKIQKISWAWWCVPVIPATQETEAGELPEPVRQRLQ